MERKTTEGEYKPGRWYHNGKPVKPGIKPGELLEAVLNGTIEQYLEQPTSEQGESIENEKIIAANLVRV